MAWSRIVARPRPPRKAVVAAALGIVLVHLPGPPGGTWAWAGAGTVLVAPAPLAWEKHATHRPGAVLVRFAVPAEVHGTETARQTSARGAEPHAATRSPGGRSDHSVLPEGTDLGALPVGADLSVLPEGTALGALPVGAVRGVLPERTALGAVPEGVVHGVLPEGTALSALPVGAVLGVQLASGLYDVTVPVGREREYAARLAAWPGVVYADVDHAVRAFGAPVPDDPLYREQWNLADIGMPGAWSLTTDAAAVPVAVLDTGITLDHPDLAASLWRNPGEIADNGRDDDGNGFVDDLHGWRFYQHFAGGRANPRDNGDLTDANGHGTHTAGVIGAVGDNGEGVTGVAWRARLMVLRVLDDDAIGWESDIVRGIDYALEGGARVINLSLGMPQRGPALAEAIGRAEAAGALVIAATGNDGGPVAYPARDPRVLGVGASTRARSPAGFSSRGSGLDLLAPGVGVLSTWNGRPYLMLEGTSTAAPHAAGVAALTLARWPTATAAEVRACLRWSAADIGAVGWDAASGWGIVDAGRAVRGCAGSSYLPQVSARRRAASLIP